MLFGVSAPCAAQVHKVSSEEIMDAALDMRRAAEQADKLTQPGEKYCKWGAASLDASELDTAISRFLLNHTLTVPENIAASQMWRVDVVAEGLVHQLTLGASQCAADIRHSDDAHSAFDSASSILIKMIAARLKLYNLARQQTRWQEESTSQQTRSTDAADPYSGRSQGAMRAEPREVLSAAREIEESGEAAAKVTAKAANRKECLRAAPVPLSLTFLNELIAGIGHTPQLPSYILASNMWDANEEAFAARVDIFSTMEGCLVYAGERKRARDLAGEALQAYHRLRTAIATLSVLALQQTEWEEQNARKQPDIREQ